MDRAHIWTKRTELGGRTGIASAWVYRGLRVLVAVPIAAVAVGLSVAAIAAFLIATGTSVAAAIAGTAIAVAVWLAFFATIGWLLPDLSDRSALAQEPPEGR